MFHRGGVKLEFVQNSFDLIQRFVIRLIRKGKNIQKFVIRLIRKGKKYSNNLMKINSKFVRFDSNYRVESNFSDAGYVQNSFDLI